jgi:type IV secretion system protein VirB1
MLPCIPPNAPDVGTTTALVCVVAEPLGPLATLPVVFRPPALPAAADVRSTADLSCGSTVAPQTLLAIIRVESGGKTLAIHVNGAKDQPPPARSEADATATADIWIARGYSVDLGLMQVNSRNLPALGFNVADMFRPCTNIRAGASILTANYLSALTKRSDPQSALQAALSAYNTGTFDRGFYNGYVAKYYGSGAAPIPLIVTAGLKPAGPTLPPNPYTADPIIYTRQEATNG